MLNKAFHSLYKQFTKREPAFDQEAAKVRIYKTRPSIVQAALYTGDNYGQISEVLGEFVAIPGQYVVQDSSGTMHAMSEKAFKAKYEPTVHI